jgi:LysR family transcriptional regulator, glycine cleavage system transcriptional activator
MNKSNELAIESNVANRALPPLSMLRAFEAVARHQSVTRAAAELNVTQSAVSHQVKALEQWLDAKLLMRDGRRVALTPSGAAYVPSLSAAFDLMVQATSRLERRARRPRLAVSAFSTLATHWLIPRLQKFCAEHPDIEVDLSTHQAGAMFDPAAFDVSMRCYTDDELAEAMNRRDWRGVLARPFLAESLTAVCSPALLQSKSALKSPLDVSKFTMLESRSTPTAWSDWLAVAEVPKRSWPKTRLTFDHMHLALNIAIRGGGIAIGPGAVLSDAIDAGLLALPFPSLRVAAKSNYWVRAPRSLGNAAADAFCEWLERSGEHSPERQLLSSKRSRLASPQ